MTSTAAPQLNVRLNFNNRDYEFEELPRTAQALLQDMMQIDKQIGQLQFELRHLQAARQVYGSSLRKTMNEEGQGNEHESGNGHNGNEG
jgi:hypothetical protein